MGPAASPTWAWLFAMTLPPTRLTSLQTTEWEPKGTTAEAFTNTKSGTNSVLTLVCH